MATIFFLALRLNYVIMAKHVKPCRLSRIPAPPKRNSSSCLPYEDSPYTTCGISWVLPHFVPFSHKARSMCFSWYITAEQNNSEEDSCPLRLLISRSTMPVDL